ncbi:MAG TPA: hypothetical protein VFG68_20865, partial [Fimbriiglobus sp.]|nr:hypothetical protein [Fimbriiglobus sp.]
MFSPKKWVRRWQDSRRPHRTPVTRSAVRRPSLTLTPLEDRTVPTTFTFTSPTSGGALPSGVTEVGGIVLDIVGANGARVVSQLAASSLHQGFAAVNPLTIGTQTGFTSTVVNALGGGISELAVRITLLDGDTGP